LIVSTDFPLSRSVRYSHKEEPVRPPPPARLPSFYNAKSDQTESGRSTPMSLYQGIRSLPSTMLDNLSLKGARRSGVPTPHEFRPLSDRGGGYHRRQVRSEKNKHKRCKAEVFVSRNVHISIPDLLIVDLQITRHVARVIQREEFILKLTRAMMMFGGPSHRLQSQIQCAARVLEIDLCVMYFPDNFIISFDDDSTGTSHVKIIRQTSALDLGKLSDAYQLYWKVSCICLK